MGSRGRSPAVAKLKRWRADPYRSDPMNRIHLQEPYCQCKRPWPPGPHLGSRCPCDNAGPGPKVFDPRANAMKKANSLSGGYDPSDLCPEHSITRSANGLCSMCEMPPGKVRRAVPAPRLMVWQPPRRSFGHRHSPDGLS